MKQCNCGVKTLLLVDKLERWKRLLDVSGQNTKTQVRNEIEDYIINLQKRYSDEKITKEKYQG